jgi:hypothetical protein
MRNWVELLLLIRAHFISVQNLLTWYQIWPENEYHFALWMQSNCYHWIEYSGLWRRRIIPWRACLFWKGTGDQIILSTADATFFSNENRIESLGKAEQLCTHVPVASCTAHRSKCGSSTGWLIYIYSNIKRDVFSYVINVCLM